MAREIKFSLAYRDMWQSAGRFFPTISQLKEVAPSIIGMGCFDRVETNGGAFEQVCLLMGENPNHAVREWTAPFNAAGIQTHMLERGLSALAMSPVPADVRELMFKVKKAQGVDVSRSFCGLNDIRNLRDSIEYARKAGMVSQVALAVADSPVHTLEYYRKIADKVVEYGCDEICIKDMSGLVAPAFLGELIGFIKKRYPHIPVQYHGHCGADLSCVSAVAVARAGADYIDVAMEPLSWGKAHPDVLAVRKALKSEGFMVKDMNMDAYMEVRSLTQKFIDESSGEWSIQNDSQSNSLLIGSPLPGGMMGSMIADMKFFQETINASLSVRPGTELSLDQLIRMLLQEVEYVWPRLGYPPLVTPFSQYVRNVALMNLMNMINCKPRWTNIDRDTWNMILGKMGTLPGPLAPEIMDVAERRGYEFYAGNPQDAFPDCLDRFRAMMKDEGWNEGQDHEELLEFAMHERQYRAFRKKNPV